MLNYFRLKLVMLILTFFAYQIKCQTMDVQLTNSPQFYYGHQCELTFSVISTNFSQYNTLGSEQFMITIVEGNSGVRFLDYYKGANIWTDKNLQQLNTNINNCKRGSITETFYCVDIPSSSAYPFKLQYNTTHYMYKFTITNILCPTQSVGTGIGGYHVKIKIQVPVALDSVQNKLAGDYTYQFVKLRHRVVQKILANPAYDSNGIAIPNALNQIQSNNYLVGCQSLLTISFDISNFTELNYWQKIQVSFLQPLSSVNVDTSSCMFSISEGVMSTNKFGFAQNGVVKCSYSSLTNSLTFTNPNYTTSNYVLNQAYNPYSMYHVPGMRLQIGIKLTFTTNTNLQFYYKMTASTSSKISDSGTLVNVSNSEVILYESSNIPETIYGLVQTDYQNVDGMSKISCVSMSNGTSLFTNLLNFNFQGILSIIFNSSYTISSTLSFVIIIILIIILILIITIKTKLRQGQKFIYFILILIDPILKIIFIIVINQNKGDVNSSDKGLRFILESVFVIQYCVVSFVFFVTYCAYFWANKRYLKKQNIDKKDKVNNGQEKKKSEKKGLKFIIFAMLINYKFYCVYLFDMGIIGKTQQKRLHNNQLYIKYCCHLGLQSLIILIQIFLFVGSCSSPIMTICFVIHQGILIIMIAVVGKVVFKMHKINKSKKNYQKHLEEVANGENHEKGNNEDGKINQIEDNNGNGNEDKITNNKYNYTKSQITACKKFSPFQNVLKQMQNCQSSERVFSSGINKSTK